MSTFRYLPNETRIEDWGNTFEPILDFSVADWTSNAVITLTRAFSGSSVDPRVRESILRVTMAIARFVPSNYALPCGRPFASFSVRQMAVELKLDASSTQSIQKSLRVLSLSTKSRDGASYSEAYELLWSARQGTPLIFTSDERNKRRATIWELIGAESRTRGGVSRTAAATSSGGATGNDTKSAETGKRVAERRASVATGNQCVAGADPPAVESSRDVVETDQAVVESDKPNGTTRTRGNGWTDRSSSRGDVSSSHAQYSRSVVKSATPYDTSTTTTSSLFSPSITLSEEEKEEGYQQILWLFPCAPGDRDKETRAAYSRRLEQGYSPAAIAKGASHHLMTSKGRNRTRFPLVFLDNDSLFHSYCGKIPKVIRSSYLTRLPWGWGYGFSRGQDLDSVDCPINATPYEALIAVERMVKSGVKSL